MATRNAKRTTGAGDGAKTDAKAAENAAPETAAENEQAPPADEQRVASEGETLTGDGIGEQLPEFDGAQARAAGPASGDSEEHGEIDGLYIRTARGIESRRRAGHRFNRTGHGIARSALTGDQIDALKADPALVVEDALFPAEADD